jgi:hypothetical protein
VGFLKLTHDPYFIGLKVVSQIGIESAQELNKAENSYFSGAQLPHDARFARKFG